MMRKNSSGSSGTPPEGHGDSAEDAHSYTQEEIAAKWREHEDAKAEADRQKRSKKL